MQDITGFLGTGMIHDFFQIAGIEGFYVVPSLLFSYQVPLEVSYVFLWMFELTSTNLLYISSADLVLSFSRSLLKVIMSSLMFSILPFL